MHICFNNLDMYRRLTYILIPDHKDWLLSLIRDFYYYHKKYNSMNLVDIASVLDMYNTNEFAKWLQRKGWKVEFWKSRTETVQQNNSIDRTRDRSKEIVFIYGINIADNCPKFMEYRLTRM